MTGWHALLEYQAAGFSPECEGFSFEQCLWIAESRIFCGYCAKGHLFSRVQLKRVPEYV
jgi:aerobic-type carbon monoxide dehydrogenase small subunit (CoxS/CutS family)